MRCFAAVAALALPCLALADFEGVLVSRVTTPDTGGGTGKTWISKDGVRSEMEMQVPQERQAMLGKSVRTVIILRRAEPNTTYVVDEGRKSYAVVRSDPGEHGDETQYTAKRLGKGEVAGFACDKVLLTRAGGEQSEVCVAPDFIENSEWLRALQGRSEGGMQRALRDVGVKGLPIRWASRAEQGHGFTFELVSAHRERVPASTFEIPAGYTKRESAAPMPSPEAAGQMEEGMKRLTPEQRKMMEEMMKKRGGTP